MKNHLHPLPIIQSMLCLLAGCFLTTTTFAQGNLLVTPKRIVFEGNKRSEEINLANSGKDTARYSISLIHIRMRPDGSFERITVPDSAQNFADKHIRFFPRTVTLAPNEAQSIKLQLVKTGELVTGEYRSHLYLRASPPQRPLGEEVVDGKDSVMSVRLTPVFGISIPIIIRRGSSTAAVSISDVQMDYLKKGEVAVNITFSRSGNMSVYGDVQVDHISAQGKTTRVGTVKGMAVYTPNDLRRFHLVLDNASGINYHEGRLKVLYNDQSAKPVKLADAEIALK